MNKIEIGQIEADADAAVELCRDAALASLVSCKHTLSGDDSNLKNTWEEICVQVQGEESCFWSAYEESIRDAVAGALFVLEERDRQAIWLQTDQGQDWLWDVVQSESNDAAAIPILNEDIVEFMAGRIQMLAADFTNERIAAYLSVDDDSLEDDDFDDEEDNEIDVEMVTPQNDQTTPMALEIEYFDDSWDSGKYFVCINRHYIFAASPKDGLPEWTLLNSDYQYWDAVHQRIYRNFRAERISKEDLPANLPPPPDSIPSEALNTPPPSPPKQFLATDYPVLNQYLHHCDGGASVYFLVLGEDLYESTNGDGRFHYPEAIFFDLVCATAFKQAPRSGYRYHIRPGLILLDGDHIVCQLTCRLFDHFNSETVLSMLTEMIEKHYLGSSVSTTAES